MLRRLYHVDAFTRTPGTGNPAGVVANAEGLNEEQMLAISKEFNFSETAFIFPGKDNEYDVHTRYFTPTLEVPICGHATIGSQFVRALEQGRHENYTVLNKTGSGVLPVEIILEDPDFKIVMTQGKVEFGAFIEGTNRSRLLDALGLAEDDLNTSCPIQIASTGHSKVMIGINDRKTLNGLYPDMEGLKILSPSIGGPSIGCNGYFVFCFDTNPEQSGILTHGRMFAPAIGIAEDPVTGNANGPLGAYLVHHRLVPHNGVDAQNLERLTFKGEQGEAIHRSGIVHVEVAILDNQPVRVKIGGNAVIVSKEEREL